MRIKAIIDNFAKPFIVILIGLIVAIIFDYPFLSYLLTKFSVITKVFVEYEYAQYENLILVLWTVFFLLILYQNVLKEWKHIKKGNFSFADFITIVAGAYYLIIRNQSILFESHTIELASFSWASGIKYFDIVLLTPIKNALNSTLPN
ncbi:MAG: hypothetical protein JXR50_04350 [Prolixibacteraceae bacterium]|nr:hypothetical protein [Prolixibacteraceae bacterium]MBN2648956.1 hypothetical protein [Prolixibacteraceae bacterium]